MILVQVNILDATMEKALSPPTETEVFTITNFKHEPGNL